MEINARTNELYVSDRCMLRVTVFALSTSEVARCINVQHLYAPPKVAARHRQWCLHACYCVTFLEKNLTLLGDAVEFRLFDHRRSAANDLHQNYVVPNVRLDDAAPVAVHAWVDEQRVFVAFVNKCSRSSASSPIKLFCVASC